ncbi:hypothetical protein F0562_007898 [Nyssa sinensis]|uniref:Expansin-like EG45 domain-containing protein n=1 Tax=Nyssa sinensis TaxID=561372 RepID=A0A5J5A826_9ASTE|nr:hypothetical protein F0562_007898 [Nyssa sinensis]
MGFALQYCCSLLFVTVLLPAVLCCSQDFFVSSRATFYASPDSLGNPTGACGFGEYGRTVNGGEVSGVSGLYKNGTGCGACYQVRCKNPQYCSEDGAKIVVTDYGEGDRTDFILSLRAYTKLARPNMVVELQAYGVVDIEYQSIPCQYPGSNLMFKVHEHSRFPEYLAIVILYQAGVNEITSVEVWQNDCQQWRGMRRAYGAVWDMANPPRGALDLRFQVSGSAGVKWMQMRNVIPSDWKAGAAYETGIQLA